MLTTKTTATKTEDTALVLLESSASTALPTAIKRLLPSISSLVDEDVVHRREMFLEIAERVEAAASELELMNVRAAPAEVIKFMTMFAERRGFNLPEPALLVMDAHSVAEIIPADLFKLACRRLWAEFRYRRLPEPPDFTQAVSEEIAERREAAARVRSVALKIETAKMYEELDARSRERHTFNKAAEYKRENARQAAQRDNSKFDTVVVSNPALGKGKAPLQAMPDLALDVEIDDSGRCPTQCGRAVLTQQDDQWSCQRDNMMDDCSDRAAVDIGTDDATLSGSMVTLLLLFTAYRISYSRPGCTAYLLWENRNKHSFSHFEERCRRTSQNNNSSYLEDLQLLPSVFHCKNNEGKVLVKLSIDGIAVQADYLKVLPFRHPVRHLAACCVDHNGSIPPASTSYSINITDEHNSVPVRQSNLDNVVPTAGIAMYVSTCSIFFDLKQHGMSSKPLLRSDGALRSTEGSVFSLRIHPKQIFLLWACAEKPAHDWPHQIEDEAYQQPAFLYMLQVTTTHSYRDTSVGTVWSAVNTRRNVCIDGASDFRGRRHRLNRDGGDSSHFHDCSRWAWQTIVISLAGWASPTAQIVLWFFPPSRGMPLVSIKPLPSPYANSEDFSEAA